MKSCLTGSAHQIISAFAIANKDYKLVVQALKEKYDSPTVIIASLYDELECLPHVTEQNFQSFLKNLQRLLQLLKHHGENINATLIQRTIERKLPKTILLQLEQYRVQNPTWNVESLIQQLFLLLTQNENIHRALKISVQQQPKNIQHTTATRNRTSAFSATSSPAPKSTERPTIHNIQKSEQKPQKRQPETPCAFCSGMH